MKIIRLIVALIVLVLALVARPAYAQSDNHPEEGESAAHCQSEKGIIASVYARSDLYCLKQSIDTTTSSWTVCRPNGANCIPFGNNYAIYHRFPTAMTCAARNTDPEKAPGPRWFGEQTYKKCVTGCSLEGTGATQYKVNSDGVPFWYHNVAYGAACDYKVTSPPVTEPVDPKNPPLDDFCTDTGGGYKVCPNPYGKTCIKTPSGGSHCYDASETGAKVNGQEAAVRRQAPETPQPPSTPPDGEGSAWNPAPTNTSTTTVNTTTYNSSTFVGGTGGNNPGTGGGTGGDNGGSGDGDGNNNNCEPATQDCTGAGTAGAGVSGLYTKSTDTVSSIFGTYFAAAQTTPLYSSVMNFFGSGCGLGGQCPIYTWEAEDFFTVSTDVFCSDTAASILEFASWILFAVALMCAFKIAVDY